MPPHSAALSPAGPESPQGDTKSRLLDSVIRIFAARGFHATSMRAVTQLAGTSVSAAHYHFGSKEELLRTALRLRAEPLNARRLESLARVEAGKTEGTERVKAILEAFILPLFELRPELGDRSSPQRGLAARLYVDPPEVVKKMQEEVFSAVTARFGESLGRAMEGTDPATIDLALQLSMGVVVHSISGRLRWPENDEASSDARRTRILEGLIEFSTAGVMAMLGEGADESPPARGSAQ